MSDTPRDALTKLKVWWAGLDPDSTYCAGNPTFASDVIALMHRCEKAERELAEARENAITPGIAAVVRAAGRQVEARHRLVGAGSPLEGPLDEGYGDARERTERAYDALTPEEREKVREK